MIKVMPREITRFVQSRFGEIRVSEARYEDLLGETDRRYPGISSTYLALYVLVYRLNH